MSQTALNAKCDLPDISKFIETIKAADELFDNGEDVFVTRAPGRLDVMGGIADYSGSLVLEMPIREAALVALQKRDERTLKIISCGAAGNNRTLSFEMSLNDFEPGGKVLDYAAAREKFRSDSQTSWAAYVAGGFLVLMRERGIKFTAGASILIDSEVPEGKGVSSSAAIEVATLSALAAAFEIRLDAREIAVLCQKVENLVVGAPCGIMDQMASVCGEEDQLMSMICQPAEVRANVMIPPDLAVWGIDSGIRHSVGAGDYGSVRTGAFMGYRMIAELAGLKAEQTPIGGLVKIADEKWNGYLANISPAEFERNFAAHLPQEISGAKFLKHYQGITDPVTRVCPAKKYAVYHPTRHPIDENFRVHRFEGLLSETLTKNSLRDLGELMYESHRSYSACGLGTQGTDLLVELVAESRSLYGAKITGGGSGGTVAVLGKKSAASEIRKVTNKYAKQTGYQPYVFSGSSAGAAYFDYVHFKHKN